MIKELQKSYKQKLETFSVEIKEDIYAAYLVYKDSRTPILPKILIVILIAYFLSPIDIIPDFIPFFGYLDDLVIIPLGLFMIKKMIPIEIWAIAKKQANKDLPKLTYLKYTFFTLIILFWLIVLYFIIRLFI